MVLHVISSNFGFLLEAEVLVLATVAVIVMMMVRAMVRVKQYQL